MPNFDSFRRHHFGGAILAALLFIPTIVGPTWSLFSEKPLVPTVVGWIKGADVNITWSLSWLSPVAAIIGLFLLLLIVYQTNNNNPVQRRKNWNAQKKTPVAGKRFHNEKVILDGKSFSGCTFRNVTFVLKGGPFDFKNNTLEGDRFIELHKDIDPGSEILVRLMKALQIPPNSLPD